MAEGRVVPSDPGERHEGGHRPLHPPLEEDVPDRHLQQVPDLTLALGAAHVERHRSDLVLRELLLQQDPPDLRPVAVRDHDLPPGRGDVGHAFRREPGRPAHLLGRVLLPPPQQRVSTERHHHSLHGVSPAGLERARRGPWESPRARGART